MTRESDEQTRREYDRRVRMTAASCHPAHSAEEPSPNCPRCWYDWPVATEEERKAWIVRMAE